MEVISGLRVVVNMLGLVDCDGVVGFLLVVLDYLGVDVTGDPVAIGWAALHMLLSALAICASLIGFVLPRFTTILEIQNAGTVGGRSSIPYVATFFNCLLGVLYARGNWVTGFTHLFGAICFAAYFLKFLQFCEDEDYLWFFVFPTAASHSMFMLVVYYFSNMEANLVFLSWVYVLWRVSCAILPLLKLRVVFSDWNMASMPPFVSSITAFVIGGLGIAVAWTASEWDGFAFWASFAGFVSALIQVSLHIVLGG